jgi:NRPS condensation-like uncharacterized protein
MAMAHGQAQQWYRLDNAGVLYSALKKEKYAPVYRFSAVMTEPVDPAALQRAVDRTMPRFPCFRVRIRKGVFWCYFEPNEKPGPFVKPDIANPCQPLRDRSDNDWLIRFFYYQDRISFEAYHAISDGAGAIRFFRTFLAEYLRQTGVEVPPDPLLLDLEEEPRPQELEDAYGRCAGKKVLRTGLAPTAYANVSPQEPFYTLNVTMGLMSVAAVKAKAKEYGVSITEYLAAVLLLSLLEKQAAEKPHRLRPVALAVPVDLRGWFPSETLRNFILTLRLAVDPNLGEYTLQDIAQHVHHYMRLHLSRQEMQATLTGNVKFTRNPLLQVVPLFLKKPVMAFSYKLLGVRPYTATYTNPGPFPVTEAMGPHIRRMEVMLGQATRPSPHCASISYGDTLEVTFAGTGRSSETERLFFTHLVQEGIPVKVISNRTH